MSENKSNIIIRTARSDKSDIAAVKSLLMETLEFHESIAGNEISLKFRPAAQVSYLEDCIWFVRETANNKAQDAHAFLACSIIPQRLGFKPQEKPVGFLMVRIQRDQFYSAETYGYIEQLIVNEQARHLGVGTKLLDAACEWLRSRNIHTATLKVYGPNLDALRFYEREGFHTLRHELVKHF